MEKIRIKEALLKNGYDVNDSMTEDELNSVLGTLTIKEVLEISEIDTSDIVAEADKILLSDIEISDNLAEKDLLDLFHIMLNYVFNTQFNEEHETSENSSEVINSSFKEIMTRCYFYGIKIPSKKLLDNFKNALRFLNTEIKVKLNS